MQKGSAVIYLQLVRKKNLLLPVQLMLCFVVLSVPQVEVKVEEGSDSVILPCKTTPDLPEDTRVEWTRSEVGLITVHEYSNRNDDLMTQDEVYRDRTKMNEDLLRTGDLSLTLKQPKVKDTGRYICTIYRDKDILRQKVVLQVKGQRSIYRSEVNVVDTGSQFVILPCNTTPDLPEDSTVEWTRSDLGLITVHEYSNRNDELMTQDEVYRDRTKMNEDLLRTGDLSLTLKQPKVKDTGRYICTIYRDKDILRQKVVLQVKGQCCKLRSEVSFLDTGHRSEIFFMLIHRTISILVQSFSGSPGSPGCSWGFWRSFFSFAAVFHVR
uniref:Ig-like domain-containing protein n=1 Tax=Haplochromis burtoni TaxID=8153 RepID=A0A3Q2VKB4_HAPBU